MFKDDEELIEVAFSELNFGPNGLAWIQQNAESFGFNVQRHKQVKVGDSSCYSYSSRLWQL